MLKSRLDRLHTESDVGDAQAALADVAVAQAWRDGGRLPRHRRRVDVLQQQLFLGQRLLQLHAQLLIRALEFFHAVQAGDGGSATATQPPSI